ncbi:hypothetical protein GCM10007216_05890 [Thalassobacillus devorans]|uniref:Uncharacterized protein n=1 Tax=Thalassobacillus devorans TaxID=279813 RepID=A0ABQ1NMS7_9BACI|nr:hypothetical protein [Thalassobacillus devorans]NIK27497.1 hypothetical protein [Thalassobacillus devorans]GGC78195.1 hypothetical protein GCM10007216_05890 [Thalassobacillus devorans]
MLKVRKYAVFIISFFLLYSLFAFLTGWVMTAAYTADFSVSNGTGEETDYGRQTFAPLVISMLAGTAAYGFAEKMNGKKG